MKLITGSSISMTYSEPVALTFGNFDGVHRGHQYILKQLKARARALGLPAMVLLFEPQPLEFFNPSQGIVRISTLRDKIRALNDYGIDVVACLRFDQDLASRTPDWMIHELLIRRLKAQWVLVGEDSRFGRARLGNAEYLCQRMHDLGYGAARVSNFDETGERISSTRIRNALSQGDFNTAEILLGRPYQVSGRVGYGQQQARQWGFPTANVGVRHERPPISGVFAVRVKDASGCVTPGIANWGVRPTIHGIKRVLEVHRFQWSGSLYGQMIEVSFLHKIRNELKFGSLDALACQIHEDIQHAQAFFERNEIERIVS